MGHGRTDEFRKNTVRKSLTSGLTRKQVPDDLGVGFEDIPQASCEAYGITTFQKPGRYFGEARVA
jgi:hypothetical protein